MTASNGDHLSEMLGDGWKIVGHSVCMMAAGALSHNILIQKDTNITSITILTMGEREIARTVNVFAPSVEPPVKKGFFG